MKAIENRILEFLLIFNMMLFLHYQSRLNVKEPIDDYKKSDAKWITWFPFP